MGESDYEPQPRPESAPSREKEEILLLGEEAWRFPVSVSTLSCLSLETVTPVNGLRFLWGRTK